MRVRNYNPETDYGGVKKLYSSPEYFGGEYDDARDAENRLRSLVEQKSDAILVAEYNDCIVGTVTLFEDGRSAWLYRFAVKLEYEQEVVRLLYDEAIRILREKGYPQILVYAPAGNPKFEERYKSLGFNKGNAFTAFWQDI